MYLCVYYLYLFVRLHVCVLHAKLKFLRTMFHFFKLRKIETHLNESLKETPNHPNETEALR